ncbi:hypothetical protein [Vreelandella populi]|uniref:hypothetical protein n=1 Tax=Vreelandella populi TaxID=2498858 RepID=UPI000F8EEB9B|nr:hypothetical protein [Halomonas populi]RUR52020.1 hypothetical protein ELY40_15015 [Halomonas populi]
MKNVGIYEATGLSSEELYEVFNKNPRAYMAVRGAVAEKHLEKHLTYLYNQGYIQGYRSASGDMEKDFYVLINGVWKTIECKNVQVIPITNKTQQIDYIEFLIERGMISLQYLNSIIVSIGVAAPEIPLEQLPASHIKEIYKRLPQELRESGLTKYQYSSSKVRVTNIGIVSDDEFISQFHNSPMTIDFQRTRNSTDLVDGDTRRNRYYQLGEFDIVAACLFTRTTEWRFLYASANFVARHQTYPDRHSNKLTIHPGDWTSDLNAVLNYCLQSHGR